MSSYTHLNISQAVLHFLPADLIFCTLNAIAIRMCDDCLLFQQPPIITCRRHYMHYYLSIHVWKKKNPHIHITHSSLNTLTHTPCTCSNTRKHRCAHILHTLPIETKEIHLTVWSDWCHSGGHRLLLTWGILAWIGLCFTSEGRE